MTRARHADSLYDFSSVKNDQDATVGHGASASVVLAPNGDAIKIFRKCDPEEALVYCAREVVISNSLSGHERVVQFKGAKTSTQSTMIAMKAYNCDLYSWLTTTSQAKRSSNLFTIATHLVEAIHYVHDMGMIHRDIKSNNILLDGDGNGGIASCVLADFGLARPATDFTDNTYFTGEVITLAYRPPELLFTNRRIPPPPVKYTQAVDMWSVGLALLDIIMGGYTIDVLSMSEAANYIEPYMTHKGTRFNLKIYLEQMHKSRPRALRWEDVDKRVIGVIEGCLDKNPERRMTARTAALIMATDMDHNGHKIKTLDVPKAECLQQIWGDKRKTLIHKIAHVFNNVEISHPYAFVAAVDIMDHMLGRTSPEKESEHKLNMLAAAACMLGHYLYHQYGIDEDTLMAFVIGNDPLVALHRVHGDEAYIPLAHHRAHLLLEEIRWTMPPMRDGGARKERGDIEKLGQLVF